MDTDIRWKQRFSSYQKALTKLLSVTNEADINMLTELEQEGLIQRFEYTYELAWKTLKDTLESKGYNDVKGPMPALRQALKDGYISDERGWRMLHEDRNVVSHTYNEDDASEIVKRIYNIYARLFTELEERLTEEL